MNNPCYDRQSAPCWPHVLLSCRSVCLGVSQQPAELLLGFAPGLSSHPPVASGALPRSVGGSRSWVLSEGSVGGWSSGLGPQQPFQVCRCSSLHTGQCCPCQITCAEMLLRSFSSFLLAPGVLVLKCWSRCRFQLSRLFLVHSMAHTV